MKNKLLLIAGGVILFLCMILFAWGSVTENPKSQWQIHTAVRDWPEGGIKKGDQIIDYRYVVQAPAPEWVWNLRVPAPTSTPVNTPDRAATAAVQATATVQKAVDDAKIQQIQQGLPLHVEIATTSCVQNETCPLLATVTGGTPPFKFYWSALDGFNSTLEAPQHIYASAQPITTTLTVLDAKNKTAATQRQIAITQPNPPIQIGVKLIPEVKPTYTSLSAFILDVLIAGMLLFMAVLTFYVFWGKGGHKQVANMSDSATKVMKAVHESNEHTWGLLWIGGLIVVVIVVLARLYFFGF